MDSFYEFPHDPLMWESTRFFYDKPINSEDQPGKPRQGTLRLSLAIMEFITSMSPKCLISVVDTKTEKACQRLGFVMERINKPQPLK